MVKISKSLSNFIANFEENIEKELTSKTPEQVMESEDLDTEIELDLSTEMEDFSDLD